LIARWEGRSVADGDVGKYGSVHTAWPFH
jgi:hypothetical protein